MCEAPHKHLRYIIAIGIQLQALRTQIFTEKLLHKKEFRKIKRKSMCEDLI